MPIGTAVFTIGRMVISPTRSTVNGSVTCTVTADSVQR